MCCSCIYQLRATLNVLLFTANVVQQTTEYTSSSPSVEVITLAASSAFVSVSGSVAVSVAVTVAVSVVIFVVVVVVVARKRRAGSHNVV